MCQAVDVVARSVGKSGTLTAHSVRLEFPAATTRHFPTVPSRQFRQCEGWIYPGAQLLRELLEWVGWVGLGHSFCQRLQPDRPMVDPNLSAKHRSAAVHICESLSAAAELRACMCRTLTRIVSRRPHSACISAGQPCSSRPLKAMCLPVNG